MNRTIFSTISALMVLFLICAESVQAEPTVVSSISPEDLVEFADQPQEIRNLIQVALSLTGKKLAYRFGSNSPKNGGMDCSGTVQYTLSKAGLSKIPRTSFDLYQWVENSGEIHTTRKIYDRKDPAFTALRPGDLLFWEGTYSTGKRNPPISHVMIYLGTLKKDNQGVVYGASSGRRYRGKKIHGVSVFDFRIPPRESSARLIGYGAIPELLKNTEEISATESEKNKGKKTIREWLGLKKKTPATKKVTRKIPLAIPVSPATSNEELSGESENTDPAEE